MQRERERKKERERDKERHTDKQTERSRDTGGARHYSTSAQAFILKISRERERKINKWLHTKNGREKRPFLPKFF